MFTVDYQGRYLISKVFVWHPSLNVCRFSFGLFSFPRVEHLMSYLSVRRDGQCSQCQDNKDTYSLIIKWSSCFNEACHTCPSLCLFFQWWAYLIQPFGVIDMSLARDERPCMFGEGNNFLCRISTKLPLSNAVPYWAFRGNLMPPFQALLGFCYVSQTLHTAFLPPADWLLGFSFLCSAESVTTYPSAFLLPKLSWHFSSLLLPLWVLYSFLYSFWGI